MGPSVLTCAPWVYFRSRLGFIYAGRGYLREKNQPRKPVHMRGFYHKKGPNHFLQNAEIIDIGSFTKYTGWVRVGAPRWSRGLLEIGFFVPAVGRGVWGSGAHPLAAGRSQRRVNRESTRRCRRPVRRALRRPIGRCGGSLTSRIGRTTDRCQPTALLIRWSLVRIPVSYTHLRAH